MTTYYGNPEVDILRTEFNNLKGKILSKNIPVYQTEYQLFLRNWLSKNTLNDNILLYHQVGTGKTCSAITIAEGFKEYINDIGQQILVIASNDILQENFKNQLMSRCTNKEYQISTNPVDAEFSKKEVKDKIENLYEFSTYTKFNDSSVTNRVVIIDEVHNITQNEYYTKFIKIFKNSYNFRLILLSATPVVNRIEEIIDISNLLNTDEPEKYIDKSSSKLVEVLDSKYSRFTQLGFEKLEQALYGKVSYVTENIRDMPTKIFNGKSNVELEGNFVFVEMTNLQKQKYAEIYTSAKSTEHIENSLHYASTIVYPGANIMYNPEIPDKVFTTELAKYSSKLSLLLENLKNAISKKELSFIYTNYKTNGTDVLGRILELNGIRFSVITGDTLKKKSVISRFNNPSNKDGSNISVLLGTDAIAEGVTLKNVRHVHIIKPHWNFSKLDQVIGRAVRRNSHIALESGKRNVKIYRYISTGHEEYNIDFEKYKISLTKDKLNATVYRLLKESSVDCVLNKENYNAYISNFKDNSRECDYKECIYECKLSRQVNTDNTMQGSIPSTYIIDIDFFEEFQLKEMEEKIRNLFKMYFIWDLDIILSIMRAEYGSISSQAVFHILSKFVNKKTYVQDIYGRDGIIQVFGEHYIFKPLDKNDFDSFYTRALDFTRNYDVDFLFSDEQSTSNDTVKSRKKVISIDTPHGIYGVIIKGVFKIVYPQNTDNSGDKRKVATGNVSLTVNKLLEVADILQIPEALTRNKKGGFKTKGELYQLIRAILEANDWIVTMD
jgi:superfamily II DNA or RNA helicase